MDADFPPRGEQPEVKTRLCKLKMFHPEWDIHTWGFMNLALVHKERRQEGRGEERRREMTERTGVHGVTCKHTLSLAR